MTLILRPAAALAALLFHAPALADEPRWSLSGLDMLQSAFVDAARDRIVVNVVAGHPRSSRARVR